MNWNDNELLEVCDNNTLALQRASYVKWLYTYDILFGLEMTHPHYIIRMDHNYFLKNISINKGIKWSMSHRTWVFLKLSKYYLQIGNFLE